MGHPDVPGLENEYPDKRAYGWIEELVAKEDGLYGRVKWSDSGKELLANAHYKFLSPFWNAETVQEGGKKYFRPVELVSVALTNKPNLPVNPLANEERKENTMERAILIALLGLANEATDEQIKTAITNNKQAAVTQAEAATALSNEKTAHGSTKSNLELQLANARTELANHKKGRIELMVDSAIKEGRVPVANRGQWIADLETDFVGKSAALANEKVTVPTQSKTGAMGNRRDPVALANEQAINRQVRALMNEKTAKGMAYDDAWALVQQERPELFKAMVQPEAAGN